MLTPTQQCEIGKRAAAHGVTASLRYHAKKYPRLPLTETSVRRFKNLYKETVKKKIDQVKKSQVASANAGNDNPDAQPDCEVHKLPRKITVVVA